MFLIYLKRFFRRLRYAFNFDTIKNWRFESCRSCGSSFKIAYEVNDELWIKVYGSEDGCLCLNCFLELALSKGIIVKPENLTWLNLFYGDVGDYDIIAYH